MKFIRYESAKYALLFAIVATSYSFAQCYKFIAYKEPVSLGRSIYCSIGFFQFIPRPFSVIDFVIHLFVWVVISMALYRLYFRFFKR